MLAAANKYMISYEKHDAILLLLLNFHCHLETATVYIMNIYRITTTFKTEH